MEKISGFTGEYEFLSNDYPCEIIDSEGVKYTNVTSAFIAQRTMDIGSRRKFGRINGPKARKKASSVPITNPDYGDTCLRHLLFIKFKNNTALKEKLKATGDAELINVVTYPDTKYGVHYGEGNNLLGKFLMQVRNDLD